MCRLKPLPSQAPHVMGEAGWSSRYVSLAHTNSALLQLIKRRSWSSSATTEADVASPLPATGAALAGRPDAPRLSRDHCSPSDRRCRSRFDRAAGLTRCMGSRTRGAVAVVHGLQTHLAGKAPSKRAAGVDCKSTEAKQMPSQCMSSRVEGWSVRYQEAKMLAF